MDKSNAKTIVGAAVGNCVHVAGVANFLRQARQQGMNTKFLGAAVPVDKILRIIEEEHPEYLAVSYRLTPENAEVVLSELQAGMIAFPDTKVLFGGTKKVVEIAEKIGGFEKCFVGEEPAQIIDNYIRKIVGEFVDDLEPESEIMCELTNLLKKGPRERLIEPIIRHHFGLPSLKDTVAGIRDIANSGLIDIISLATDQNAQEFFFRQEQLDPKLDGAGGVPVRSREHLQEIYAASQTGNYPRLRVYAGTQDLQEWAELSISTINQAWGTVPLTWYSELDGRSTRTLEEAIAENQNIMRYYASRGIPLEVNEAHHWSLREASDQIAVAMAFLAAYNAKAAGVQDFFAQYMLNTPLYTSQSNDLAKMRAKMELIESLSCASFKTYRQMRAGLTHFSNDLDVAKGQLAQTATTIMSMNPHILHVVGYTEASHAADADEVISSVKIVKGVLRNLAHDPARFELSMEIENRKNEILRDAKLILDAIYQVGMNLGAADPFIDPVTISHCVKVGILDAPHLAGQKCALGKISTLPINGACRVVDPETFVEVSEKDRLSDISISLNLNLDFKRTFFG